MTLTLLTRVCMFCRDFYAAELVESRTEDAIESHGICSECALGRFLAEDAAESCCARCMDADAAAAQRELVEA